MSAAPRSHAGSWSYHPDDCRCVEADRHCNRDGHCWSCCGACKEDSECTAPILHPTHWSHPRYAATVARYERHWPVFRSNEEIRAAVPECFPP